MLLLRKSRQYFSTKRASRFLLGLIGLFLLILSGSFALAQGPGTITIVDSAGKVGGIIRLVLTSEGLPIIGYSDSTDDYYSKIAFCEQLTCTSKKLAAIYDSNGIESIQLKAGNLPVILYDAYPNPRLIVCQDPTCNHFTNTTAFEVPSDEDFLTGGMTLTPAGVPVIAFYDLSVGRIHLVRCSDPTCSTPPTRRVIERIDSYIVDLEIVLTQDDRPLISYSTYKSSEAGGDDIIRLVVCQDPNCVNSTLTVVDHEDSLSGNVSLQLNSAGVPVISYIVLHEALRVALCDDLVCEFPEIKTIDTGIEEVDWDQSMVLTSDDRPIISYGTGYPDYDLKLAVCSDPQCSEVTITILDSKEEAGGYPSMALTGDDLPVVAYENSLQQDLLLYTFNLGNVSANFNYFQGGPESVFTLTGSDFPANAPVTVTINGTLINTNLTTDASGNFTCLFDSAGADLGYYTVKIEAEAELGFSVERQASFLIEAAAPKRVAGVDAPIVDVPAGLGLPPRFSWLPLVIK